MQSLKAGAAGTVVCDVLIAGGGVAGVAAAIAAARAGCRTVLIEREASPGGIGTRGMLRTICGLYRNGSDEPEEPLNPGLTREIVAALRSGAPHRTITRVGKVFVLPYASENLEQVLDSLCRREADLAAFFRTTAVAVSAEAGRITAVTVEQEESHRRISPRVVVDCTGNGDVAVMAGAAFDLAPQEELQLAGFTVLVRGVRGRDESLALKVPYALSQAVEKGELLPATRFTTFNSGDEPDEGYLKFSVEGQANPERNDRAREEAEKAVRLLAERLAAFRGATIAGTSPCVLDREGKRIHGEYVLTEADVLSARKFPDGVVKNSWPVELWDRHRGPVYKYLPDGAYYEIPFRCLKVEGFSNLLTAGRCISATHEAQGSTRVMGACMALGDAAGRAAAEHTKKGTYPAFGEEKS